MAFTIVPNDQPCDTCDTCGDWLEIHAGEPACKSGCKQPNGPEQHPCDHCHEPVPVDEACGDDEHYLCPDCYGAAVSTEDNEFARLAEWWAT